MKNKIETIYANKKARPFIKHLIRAYIPIGKMSKVMKFKVQKQHKCTCCEIDLIDMTTVFERLQDQSLCNEFVKDLRIKLLPDGSVEKLQNDNFFKKHISKGQLLAWTGVNTDTYMCMDCIHDLIDFVEQKILRQDENIIYVMKQNQREYMNSKMPSDIKSDNKMRQPTVTKKKESIPTTTFGDIEALQKLKEKMQSELPTHSKTDGMGFKGQRSN